MPNVVILAGPNGAGKSTVAPAVIHELLALGTFVNADVIARGLAGFDVEAAAIQAGRIMLQRLAELAAQRADFAFETTLASRAFAPFLKRLSEDGYQVRLVYVWLNDPSLCVQRVAERVRLGGHGIEENVVRRRYQRSIVNFFSLYQQLADRWEVFDNTSGGVARLVAEGRRTLVTVMHDPEVWDRFLQRTGHEREP